MSDAVDDIELEAAWKSASTERRVGFNVRVGGEVGPREPRRARSLDLFVPPERAVDAVHALVAYYHDTRDGSQFVVEDRETGAIRDAVAARLEVESAGQPLHDAEETDKPRWDGLHDHVGVYEQRDGLNYVGLSVPLGRLTAKETIALAHLASEYGSGELRLTRRQNPVMMDVPDRNVAPLLSEPLLETHTPEPGPFVRGARACAGAEFCSLALTETKVRMAATLRWLRANVAVPEDVGQIAIHYSGCTADCAGAMTADIGLQGMQVPKNGEMVAAADVGVGGGLDDSPRFVEWLHQRVPVDELPGLLRNLVKAFGANREEGQSFRAWVDETGVEAIAAMAEPTETDYVDPCLTDAAGSWYPYEQHRTPTTPGDTPISADD